MSLSCRGYKATQFFSYISQNLQGSGGPPCTQPVVLGAQLSGPVALTWDKRPQGIHSMFLGGTSYLQAGSCFPGREMEAQPHQLDFSRITTPS